MFIKLIAKIIRLLDGAVILFKTALHMLHLHIYKKTTI